MRLFVLITVTCLFLLVGLIAPNSTLLLFALPFLCLIVLSLAQSADTVALTATRTLSAAQITVGETADITLTVRNDGDTIDELILSDICPPELTIEEGENTAVRRLAKGETLTLTWRVRPARGVWYFTHTDVTVSNRVGLMGVSKQIEVNGQIRLTVLIQPEKVSDITIRPRQTRAFAGNIPASLAGSGSDFFGVRPYRPGDSLRHVNWRLTARQPDALFTNEFEQARVADVGLIVDARRRSVQLADNNALFEQGIAAASAFAEAFITAGNRVSMLAYGDVLQHTIPGYGKIQRQRILNLLSQIKPGDSQIHSTLDHLPTRLFPPKSQIVLFSPLLPSDLPALQKIRAHGYSLLVIAPDPIAHEVAHLPPKRIHDRGRRIAQMERVILINNLAAAGIQVVEWSAEQPLEQLVRTYLRRPHGGRR